MKTIRSFIAIELSDAAKARLTELQAQLKAAVPPHTVRWTAPQNLHLTLHFLGDVAEENIALATQAMITGTDQLEPFSLTLRDLGFFPNVRRPRIMWIGVGGQTEQLVELHSRLGQALNELTGFTPDSRPYAPHLTLSRVNKGLPSRRLNQLAEVLIEEQPKVGTLADLMVADIHLIKSELKAAGPVYKALASVEFNP